MMRLSRGTRNVLYVLQPKISIPLGNYSKIIYSKAFAPVYYQMINTYLDSDHFGTGLNQVDPTKVSLKLETSVYILFLFITLFVL